ncbi:hypothetical protein E3O46_02050 [Cryobacterium glucosi]|uniref:AAA family ATPase n=2 Tax=Cryobacterium glucosi TaxID=1259175 RepID=A0ABY2IUB3_9MICO|nr:hypothetical protein E3O46_02050 [Cryobacterium glucosi]
MLQFHGTDRPAALHRREELDRYLSMTTVKPDIISDADYDDMTASARMNYDRQRMVYLSGGIVLGTPNLQRAKVMLGQCFAENVGRNSGHAGLMLDGDSAVGKTTAAKALMKYVFNQYQRQFPEFQKHDRVPVVYVEVPAGSTGKLLMKTFADFFGLTIRSGESMVSIRSRVVDTLNAAGTQLIVVDELHNLAGRAAGNGESVDVLKNLHNDLACTFVYAGIGLTNGSILGGPRGQQLSGRFTVLHMERFKLTNPSDRKAWRAVIATFEKELPLRHHELGTLPAMSDYLFERTSGSIGSLGRLLTGSAIETIINPDITREELTLRLLESRRLDIAAESARSRATNRKKDPMSVTNILKGLATK